MYVNGGSIANDKVNVERRLGTTISDSVWSKIVELMDMTEDGKITHRSVNARLRKAITSRENGKNGGRPRNKNPENPENKPNENPPLERERESKKEIESESETDKTFSPLLSEFGNLSPREAEQRYLTQERYKGSIEQYAMVKLTTVENIEEWVKQFTSILIRQCWKNTMEEWLKYFNNWFMKNYKLKSADEQSETAVQKRQRLLKEQQEIANSSRR